MTFIHRYEWIAYGLLAIAAVVASLPPFPYGWHLFLHIAGAVIFLGNIIVTGAWMLMAERTYISRVIHFSAKAVIRADFLFTLPGVLLVLINGLIMAYARWGGAFRDFDWIKRRCGPLRDVWNHLGWGSTPPATPYVGTPRHDLPTQTPCHRSFTPRCTNGTSGEWSLFCCLWGRFT